MSDWSNRKYLLGSQYRDAGHLNARVALHDLYSTNPYGWHRWVFDHLLRDLGPDSRILEVGCGPALLWAQNIGSLPDDWRVTLTDFSAGMGATVRKNMAGLVESKQFVFAVADAQSLPFPESSFDVVIANHMLYHVLDRERAHAEIWRVLNPGGLFYASTIGEAHMRELDDIVRQLGYAEANPMTPTFNLETGGGELSRHFEAVTLDRYDDALLVTEAAPLVAYVASGQYLTDTQLEGLASFARQEIMTNGHIRIGKDSGLFTARRG